MSNETSSSIGLGDLIAKVKQDLLAVTPGQEKEPPILCVESVELELQVTVKYEGKAGVKIEVLSFGGGELGGGMSRDDIHKVKVKLAPLFDKDQMVRWYKELHPNEVLPTVRQSLDGLMKGNDTNLADRFDP
jgi:hypothetical protein